VNAINEIVARISDTLDMAFAGAPAQRPNPDTSANAFDALIRVGNSMMSTDCAEAQTALYEDCSIDLATPLKTAWDGLRRREKDVEGEYI